MNKSKDICLASKAELARTAYQRIKGLIGRSAGAFSPGSGLWIIPCEGVHTFGMSFPIDVAYLDSTNKIIRLYHGLAPYRIAAIVLRARSVLELPAGILAQTHTEVGDFLEICSEGAC